MIDEVDTVDLAELESSIAGVAGHLEAAVNAYHAALPGMRAKLAVCSLVLMLYDKLNMLPDEDTPDDAQVDAYERLPESLSEIEMVSNEKVAKAYCERLKASISESAEEYEETGGEIGVFDRKGGVH